MYFDQFVFNQRARERVREIKSTRDILKMIFFFFVHKSNMCEMEEDTKEIGPTSLSNDRERVDQQYTMTMTVCRRGIPQIKFRKTGTNSGKNYYFFSCAQVLCYESHRI